MGPWVREADDEEDDSNEGGRLRRVAGKRGVLVRQQRSLESTLVGELARGAIVELASDAVEGAARMLLSLKPRPLLIFLSMHEWCQRSRLRSSSRPGGAKQRAIHAKVAWRRRPWSTAVGREGAR